MNARMNACVRCGGIPAQEPHHLVPKADYTAVSWEIVRAWDATTLQKAVEDCCYPEREWRHLHQHAHSANAYSVAGAIYEKSIGWIAKPIPALNYLEDWRLCMPLWWRFGLVMQSPYAQAQGFVWAIPLQEMSSLAVTTESEARRAICCLAVWQALRHEGI